MDWEGEERRARNNRAVGGFVVGAPAAGVIAWYLSLRGIYMPPGVEAAVGGIITAVSICATAFLSRFCVFVLILARTLRSKAKERV